MIYDSESGDFSLALVGDIMLSRRLTVFGEERFLALRDLLSNADAAFGNLEGPVRNWDEGTPNISIATYMTTPPSYLDDLKWFGIDLVSCANNHVYDYGEGGILATLRHLDAAGIVHAGSGRNLAEAVAPGYLDTPAGRVGMIAVSCTHSPWHRAGAQRGDIVGRPGVNALDHRLTYTVDAEAFSSLERLNRELGFARANERNQKHFSARANWDRKTRPS
jgi:poly-gamma-glutamate capsule biosynthesis protein CapA/YwtB (metallophosphatase superfamily)